MHNWHYTLQRGHSISYGNNFFCQKHNNAGNGVCVWRHISCTCKLPSVGVHMLEPTIGGISWIMQGIWQLTLTHHQMPMLTLQLFHTRRHDHPMLHVVVHGTTVHFYSRELLLSCTNTIPIYRLPMQNKITNISIWYACTLLYKHVHLMVTFTSTRHMLSDVYTPFHNLWYSLAKKMLPITNGETPA